MTAVGPQTLTAFERSQLGAGLEEVAQDVWAQHKPGGHVLP